MKKKISKSFTDEERQFITDNKDKLSPAQIAKEMSRSSSGVYRFIKEGCKAKRKPSRWMTLKEEIRVLFCAIDGMNYEEIAIRMGSSRQTIYSTLRFYGLLLVKRKKTSMKLHADITEAYLCGDPICDIVQKYNVSTKTIYRILNKHEVNHSFRLLSEKKTKKVISSHRKKKSVDEILTENNLKFREHIHSVIRAQQTDNLHFKNETDKTICEMYLSGARTVNICESLGVSPGSVYFTIDKYNISKRNKILHPVDIKEAVNRHKRGESVRDLAKRYEVSATKMHGILCKNGIENKGIYTPIDTKKNAIEMYVNNFSIEDIVSTTKISISTLYRVLEENKIKLRSNR